MPYDRKSRKRKRSYKTKGRKLKRRKIRRRIPIGGFPKKWIAKLKYSQHFKLDPAAGAAAIQVFRANGCFDPDVTGTGHQPSNFDQFMLNYDRFTVIGSQCKFTECTNVTTSVIPGTMVCHLSENGTNISVAHGIGGINNILEQPRLSKNARQIGIANDGGPWTITKNFSAKKFFSAMDLNTNTYSGSDSNDPTEGAFFECAFISNDDSSNPGQVQFRVDITYVVMFSEPKLAAYS